MPKAYWVGAVDVKNQIEYKKYTDLAGPALLKAGAKILCRGGKIKNLEGKMINRIVIVEFPSLEDAEKFYNSDEYSSALKYLNLKVCDRFLNIAEGVE
tara:strand:- start:20 stop:313 length:294 start_codon:yes stop_codon:yes gene_type:complete